MERLTPTSYLVLGMLTSRDLSAYEIAEQIGKGVTEVWPRAARQMYNAPKTLVSLGLATARKERQGRRERTVYSVTPAGRAALSTWMATPVQEASLEFPAVIRVMLADEGSLEDLRATLQTVREQAEARRALFLSHLDYVANTGGSFPERAHLMLLANRFMLGHYAHLAEWATWALDEISAWTDTTAGGARDRAGVDHLPPVRPGPNPAST